MKKVNDFNLTYKVGIFLLFFLFSNVRISAYINNIADYIKAASLGGAIQSANDKILSGSQLNWGFYNNSTESVTLKSLQLIDGQTGQEGNIMSVNEDVGANSSVSYTTTIGILGINMPVTCRFRYEYYGNSYSVDAVYTNNTFPDIPTPSNSYTLTIKAAGGGSVSYKGSSVRNSSNSFNVDRFSSPTISFSPDDGYRIKCVMANNSDVTSSVYNNQYTINIITRNMTVEVEFEKIPVYTYNLTISISGNGYVDYNGTALRGASNSFTVYEGSNATFVFHPDNGYRIKSLKVNSTDVTSNVINNSYTVSIIKANTTVEVEFEAIPVNTYTLRYVVDGETYKSYELKEGAAITPEPNPQKDGYTFSGWSEIPTTMPARDVTVTGTFTKNEPEVKYYTLSIKATGSGCASYNDNTVENDTQSFSIKEGISAVVYFHPYDGCQIAKATMNGREIADLSTMSFSIDIMDENVTIEVEFEAIPVKTYILRYVVDGETYKSYELKEGVAITPEPNPQKDGYTFSGWSEIPTTMPARDVTVTGTFTKNEPEVKYYTLSIKATGSGSASYNDNSVENDTQSFSIKEGISAVIYFHPYDGSQIAKATMNGREISDLSSMSFTIDIMDEDVTIEVEFEAMPVNTYRLTYMVDGEIYKAFELEEGAVITPEAEPTKEGYTFSGWSEIPATMPANDVTITGTFTKMDSRMTIDGINYEVVSFSEHLVVVTEGDYGPVLEVPEAVTYENETWNVMGLNDGALGQSENLAAVIWNPSAVFNARVSNPNLLLYVKDEAYASFGVKNVVVNGVAESIELTDDANGNDFYCPRVFRAKNIIYKHNYQMETGLGESMGWETIVLPFDVQKYTHATKGDLESFTTWSKGSKKKPFWLFELTASGYKDVASIKANTPYIISMPNNHQYEQQYQIPGIVTFSASDVEVQKSDDLKLVSYQGRTFVPNYTNQNNADFLALNVSNNYVTNPSKDIAGSKFIRGLRAVHPFEAYMTTTDNTRSVDVMEGMTTAIRGIQMVKDEARFIKVYDTRGVLLKTVTSINDVRNGLKAGVYIVNGQKMIIK